MRVALAYNAKPAERYSLRIARPELAEEEDDEPPSLGAEEDLYAEWDDAETILAVADALAIRHEVTLVEATPTFASRIRLARPDLVFNIAEGFYGASREAQVPAILEMLGIPYTGSDPLTLGLCLDKARAKEILAYRRVPTASFAVVETPDGIDHLDAVPLPVLVKPLYEGSSKGIRDDQLVRDRERLPAVVRRVVEGYRQPALVEAFLPGREFTVAVIGNGAELQILPPVEIRFDTLPQGANPIYSWEAKWVWDRPEAPLHIFECPAPLDPAARAELESVCHAAVRALNVRDWARIDLRLDFAGRPHIIELNPLPGVLPDPMANSCFPKAARAAGMNYGDMILAVVDAARRRLGWLN